MAPAMNATSNFNAFIVYSLILSMIRKKFFLSITHITILLTVFEAFTDFFNRKRPNNWVLNVQELPANVLQIFLPLLIQKIEIFG
jgi:hypothetical protein